MTEPVVIHAPGTVCRIGEPGEWDIKAVVVAANVREGGGGRPLVSYELAWWEGFGNRQAWFSPCEIRFDDPPSLTIGFHPRGA